MVRSTAQFAVTHGTTKLFTFFGTTLIVSMCCMTGYLILTSVDYYKENIHTPVFLLIIFAIVSLPISWAFM